MAPTANDWITALVDHPGVHAPSNRLHQLLDGLERFSRADRMSDESVSYFPFRLADCDLGKVTTDDLFEVRELATMALYIKLTARYQRVADLGANIGIHSLFMSQLGWKVDAFEPDPRHTALLRENLRLNQESGVTIIEAAVDEADGQATFVRVLDNTTSSHVKGRKANPYGPLEEFTVRTVGFSHVMGTYDFVKMDVEGNEKSLILTTEASDWAKTDVLCEIGTRSDSEAIFEHAQRLHLQIFSQDTGWGLVSSIDQMPCNYRDGHVFITAGAPPYAV